VMLRRRQPRRAHDGRRCATVLLLRAVQQGGRPVCGMAVCEARCCLRPCRVSAGTLQQQQLHAAAACPASAFRLSLEAGWSVLPPCEPAQLNSGVLAGACSNNRRHAHCYSAVWCVDACVPRSVTLKENCAARHCAFGWPTHPAQNTCEAEDASENVLSLRHPPHSAPHATSVVYPYVFLFKPHVHAHVSFHSAVQTMRGMHTSACHLPPI
jgi:hypothetical protein